MDNVWAIANDHSEFTIAVGDGITFIDSLPASNRLVRRTGTMNAPPTLAGSRPDAPVIDLPVWCVRGAGNPTTVTVHASASVSPDDGYGG